MPVIVIGADTAVGEAIVGEVLEAAAEVRVFISDPNRSEKFRQLHAKVALGDLSDFSHVEAASLHCFCAVLVLEAATDQRERAFAAHPTEMVHGWNGAIRSAGVQRVIWVGEPARLETLPPPGGSTREIARVATHLTGGDPRDRQVIAREVADLEGRARLPD